MIDIALQDQINEINRKLDIVLEEVNRQRLKREEMEDLVDDVSVIGKDIFANTVQTLDKAGVELDYEALNSLLIKFVRNIGTFNQLFEMLESAADLMKDLSPIINQIGMDAIHHMTELERQGYFDFFRESKKILDNIVAHYSPQDVRELADNVVTILETVRSMTQPDMLSAMNNAVTVFKSMDTKEIKEYSMIGAFRALNSKEMRKGIGFMIAFLKKLSKSME
jgi:uncharacterized protein YjgD (DUF1641 family)